MADNQRPDGVDKRVAEDIAVPSQDPAGKENKEKTFDPKGKQVDGKKETKEEEMSDEDIGLKNELEMLVERLKETDTTLYMPALESLRTLIKTSTSSMTAVPKPLKFLRPFYQELISTFEGFDESKLENERALAFSIVSVLAMTYSDNGQRDTLHYRIYSGSKEKPGDWGNEYVRHLAAEIGEEYSLVINGAAGIVEPEQEPVKPTPKSADAMAVDDADKVVTGGTLSIPAATTAQQKVKRDLKTREQLLALALDLVPFFLAHNAEADAVDLLLELESIESLEENSFLIGKEGDAIYNRVCQYMVSCVPLLVAPDDRAFLRTAAGIYARHERWTHALALAVRLRDRKLIRKYFESPMNASMKKQLAFFLARSQIPIAWVHCSDPDSWTPPEDEQQDESEMQSEETAPPTLDDDVLECLGNLRLTEHFKRFGKQLDVSEPKSLEDIYKSHLETGRAPPSIDSARANLAGTFVNAFVNAGYGNDKLIVDVEEGQSFIYKNKDYGMMSATASLGMSMLWDTELGISQVDKYSYSSEEHIKAGALLATGILHSGIRTELDVAYALLEDHVDNKSTELKVAAINGIALACVGSCRQDIADKLLPYVADENTSMEIAANAALALGFVFVGSANGDIAITIVQSLMERLESTLSDKWARFIALALGLIYLGRQEASEATIELLKTIEHPIGKQAEIMVDMCSYAATGNVLKIQTMLHHCSDHASKPKSDEKAENTEESEDSEETTAAETENKEKKDETPADMTYQAFAVIGIALVAMGEDVGADMSLRQFNHLMTYGDPVVRKAVPLALALVSASNPQLPILDSLSRYSHDNDLDVAVNAILAMGLVGAGTNNARLAQMLRSLAGYYAKEPNCLFMVRVAQGLVHMGKGTIGVNPFYNDRQILSPSAISGLLSLLVAFTESKSFVLDKTHWMMYWLVTAMYPQFLITVDEELQEKAITVRVGQAVNTVGLAGQRMGISGFQTHQTPVRIAVGERAEFGTNEYFPYASTLEGIVIIKKNDLYEAAEDA